VPVGDQPTLGHIRDGLHWKFENLDRAPRGAERLSKKSTLERLQRRLFNDYSTVSQAAPDGEVEVFSAPGESRECVEIARRVLAFARDGISFDRIAVLLRSPEEYRAHLQEAFARARIPAHFARGAVRPDPAGRAFFSLLKCAAEGLSARRFAEYLSLAQVPEAGGGGQPPEATARGDRWVVPDPELVPQFTTDAPDEPISSAETDIPASGSDETPVLEGQLRAPRRWERQRDAGIHVARESTLARS
jgi:ATP-dependent helicase/nuclease subunit B